MSKELKSVSSGLQKRMEPVPSSELSLLEPKFVVSSTGLPLGLGLLDLDEGETGESKLQRQKEDDKFERREIRRNEELQVKQTD